MSGQSSNGSPSSTRGRITPAATSSSIRRFAFSCGTPRPASSSAIPRSILERNTSFSIASSRVASAGSSRRMSMMRSRVSRSVTTKFYASLPSLSVSNDASPGKRPHQAQERPVARRQASAGYDLFSSCCQPCARILPGRPPTEIERDMHCTPTSRASHQAGRSVSTTLTV